MYLYTLQAGFAGVCVLSLVTCHRHFFSYYFHTTASSCDFLRTIPTVVCAIYDNILRSVSKRLRDYRLKKAHAKLVELQICWANAGTWESNKSGRFSKNCSRVLFTCKRNVGRTPASTEVRLEPWIRANLCVSQQCYLCGLGLGDLGCG